jgi:carboxymethylenebutenolidase
MCHDIDALPPDLPRDLRRLAPMAGGAVESRSLTLTASDGNRFAAFVARAMEPAGSGIVIFPDVRGLFRFYEELALRFAAAGFDAVAFDYYGRSAGASTRDADFDAWGHLAQTTAKGIATDAAAAADFLRSAEGGADRAVFSVGFCFGGRNAYLNATADSPVRPQGTIAFYGALGPGRLGRPAPLERTATMRGPILGFFGGADQSIPAEQVAQFDAGLTAAGAVHELIVYPGAPHSFFDRSADQYAAEADDAWHRTVAFLLAHAPA